ncbi:hypothetical protein [Streptacidiphilus sp. EB129]|uniref:hypothetical protein n=1 Tax=Streptacidiphilus sp. EB129 TaxID=3156262 RepID=UPI003516FEBC
MSLNRSITLKCRHCTIEYTGDVVVVLRRRWWLTRHHRVFREEGGWPLQFTRAVRHRYWRRGPVGRLFHVDAMQPIRVVPQRGRWPHRVPAALVFTHATHPERRITVRVSRHLLVEHGATIERINRAITARASPGTGPGSAASPVG